MTKSYRLRAPSLFELSLKTALQIVRSPFRKAAFLLLFARQKVGQKEVDKYQESL